MEGLKSLRGMRKAHVVRPETLDQVKLLLLQGKVPPEDHPSGGPGRTKELSP